MKRFYFSAVVASIAFASSISVFARCVVSETITTPIVASNVTVADIRAAIVQGGLAKGWTVEAESTGKIVLKYVKANTHVAACDVIYNKKQYTIKMNQKTNLTRDCSNGEVHHKYNQWIRNLNKHINAKLQAKGL